MKMLKIKTDLSLVIYIADAKDSASSACAGGTMFHIGPLDRAKLRWFAEGRAVGFEIVVKCTTADVTQTLSLSNGENGVVEMELHNQLHGRDSRELIDTKTIVPGAAFKAEIISSLAA